MTDYTLSFTLKLDQQLTPFDTASERILEITLQAPEATSSFRRPALNLALVLDRSGSMAGEKLDFVKKAASHVVGLLSDKDRLALVDYDQEVRVLLNSVLLDHETRPVLNHSIRSIQSGGMTNLSGGWLTGCQEITAGVGNGTFTHALLLTDGLANVGITNHDDLKTHARELARRGISTSTFGVGADFDQHLLEDMADQGEGVFRFIESPADIPAIFESVFKDLLTIYAHEVELTITFPPELSAAVFGDYRMDNPEPGKLRIYLGSLSAGKKREVYIKFTVPPGIADTELPLKASLRAKDEQGKLLELHAGLGIQRVTAEAARAAATDEKLLERFAMVDVGNSSSEALRLEKIGRRMEASELIKRSLERQRPHLNPETQQRYTNLSARAAVGMDEIDRKRSQYDSYYLKKAMTMGQEYQLTPDAGGRMIFNVAGRNVLLDTGFHISFGNIERWELMGRQIRLVPNYKRFTPELISRMFATRIDILLGMDVLQHLDFRIDMRQQVLQFSEVRLPMFEEQIAFKTVMEVPYFMAKINNVEHKLMLDTGMKFNYMSQIAAVGLSAVGTEMDCNLNLGEFMTDVFKAEIQFPNKRAQMCFGVLPESMASSLAAFGEIDGLLGMELFSRYIAIFNMHDQILALMRYK